MYVILRRNCVSIEIKTFSEKKEKKKHNSHRRYSIHCVQRFRLYIPYECIFYGNYMTGVNVTKATSQLFGHTIRRKLMATKRKGSLAKLRFISILVFFLSTRKKYLPLVPLWLRLHSMKAEWRWKVFVGALDAFIK